MGDWEAAFVIFGLGVITLVSRGFFLFPDREVPLPAWLKQGLRYAPLAALAAVIVPEVVLVQGDFVQTWQDPRLAATLVAAAVFFWRRNILFTILAGTAVMLSLRLGLGW